MEERSFNKDALIDQFDISEKMLVFIYKRTLKEKLLNQKLLDLLRN